MHDLNYQHDGTANGMENVLQIAATRRFGTLSPLRYPGGKASLAGLFSDIIADIGIQSCRYVEPYAGGAGAGIALLRNGLIDELVINDIDPAVNAFWQSITKFNQQFIESIHTTPLTVNEWKRQRAIYKSPETTDSFNLGFAFFYLNRTNRSGILNAGVIGGQKQTGTYKIDARFNREALAERIQSIGNLSQRIKVSSDDGRTTIREYSTDPNSFIYIDPPYVQAGSQLYLNSFTRRDHISLAKIIQEISSAHWLLTYDDSKFIRELYDDEFQCDLHLNYSARHPGRATEVLVASEQVAKSIHSTWTPSSAMR